MMMIKCSIVETNIILLVHEVTIQIWYGGLVIDGNIKSMRSWCNVKTVKDCNFKIDICL